MNNILITGSLGQLGSEIKNLIINTPKSRYFFTDKADLDITDPQAVQDFVVQHSINLVINCAAYTQADKAETDEQTCHKVNCEATEHLALALKAVGGSMIHISTDYVFSGDKNTPYKETDRVNPLGVYGKTKLLAEQALQKSGIDYLILRTSWLYSVYGQNFVKTITKLSREKPELKVVFDQVGTPTNAECLAKFIIFLVEGEHFKGRKEIYHFSNEGVCSWYDFAMQIVKKAGTSAKVMPCYSSQYPTPVKRPAYSVMDKTKLKTDFGYEILHWQEALSNYFSKI